MLKSSKSSSFSPPMVTAQAWSAYDPIAKTFIGGKNDTSRCEIASISKIMTFITVLEISDEQNISLQSIIKVPSAACKIKGTSSNLIEGDTLRVIDLLYGMMVPSGNDSALALALYFGKFYHDSLPVIGFVRVMNYMAEYLELSNTFFQNPHGLSMRPNYSSACDVNVLAAYALKNKLFKEIVNTVEYSCEIFNEFSEKRRTVWKNTNKLLGKGFDGVKTGTTGKAGPCLCVRIKDPICPIIITVLKSATGQDRWNDTVILSEWVQKALKKNIY